MSRLLAASFALCALLTTVLAVSAAPPNFSGTWVLDKQKSQGLRGPMANADITLTVTQDDKQLTVETKYAGGGREMPAQKATYNLDGSETTAETTGFMAGKATYKAKWSNDGKTLELQTTIKGSRDGNEFTRTTTEQWELTEGGKVLKIVRKGEGRNGPFESTLIFNKK
jgi:hypothetical protein